MTTQLLTVRDEPITLKHPDRLYIDGEWRLPASGTTFAVIDSATEEPFYRVAKAGPADLDAAIAAARHTFDETDWAFLEPTERAEYLRKFSARITERAGEIATYWTRQTGPTYLMSSHSIARVSALLDYYAELAGTFEWVRPGDPEFANWGAVVHEPVGVVGAIVPWNVPLSLAIYKLAPAIIAGCTVILKAPPEAPGELYILAEIAEEIGLPAGVLNLITAHRDVSEQLVRDERVDKIAFTGSGPAGRRIAGLAGGRMARYTLELGGKSAAILFDDCDLEDAAKALAQAEISITGQVCMSLTRVIVTQKNHDRVAEALGEAFRNVKVGDPFDPSNQMGPLAVKRQYERVLGYVDKGVAEGATLVAGGKRPDDLDRGYFVEPTVFANVSNSSTIAREEIFGPVLSVIPAKDEDEAVRLANDTEYGLNNAVFTQDIDRAYRVARRLRSGTVGHNGFKVDPMMGYGGFKQSGYGREGGVQGLQAYLETKTVVLDGKPSHLPE